MRFYEMYFVRNDENKDAQSMKAQLYWGYNLAIKRLLRSAQWKLSPENFHIFRPICNALKQLIR